MGQLQDYQAAFTSHLRDPALYARPNGTRAARMAVYREIVFNNICASLTACFPVLHSMLGKRMFKRLMRDCFRYGQFESPLFQDIPAAFVAYLQNHASDAQQDVETNFHTQTHAAEKPAQGNASLLVPAYAAELAHYEWLELAISRQPTRPIGAEHLPVVDSAEALATQVIALTEAHYLAQYRYAVHSLSRRNRQPTPAATQLLIYRTRSHTIQFVVLNGLTAALLAQIQAQPGMTVEGHLDRLAKQLPAYPRDNLIQGGLQTVFALYQQSALCIVNTPESA